MFPAASSAFIDEFIIDYIIFIIYIYFIIFNLKKRIDKNTGT